MCTNLTYHLPGASSVTSATPSGPVRVLRCAGVWPPCSPPHSTVWFATGRPSIRQRTRSAAPRSIPYGLSIGTISAGYPRVTLKPSLRSLPTWKTALTCLEYRSRAPLPSSLSRSEEHTSELQSQSNLVCRLLLEKKKQQ